MLINEERTWERKRQLEMETALQENTEMVTELVTELVTEKITEKITEQITEQVTERVTAKVTEQNTRSFIESLILDGSMTEVQIARIAKVSVDLVKEIKLKLPLVTRKEE